MPRRKWATTKAKHHCTACGRSVGAPDAYNTVHGEWFAYLWEGNRWAGPFWDGQYCGSHWPQRREDLERTNAILPE